jgi:triacylglycerol esterase/lipase EstA (alpha/beta hydrolase family)
MACFVIDGRIQGGLDCRYLASQLKPEKFKVSSVTTIATPHRGSPFADYLIDQVLGRWSPSLLSLLPPPPPILPSLYIFTLLASPLH